MSTSETTSSAGQVPAEQRRGAAAAADIPPHAAKLKRSFSNQAAHGRWVARSASVNNQVQTQSKNARFAFEDACLAPPPARELVESSFTTPN